MFTNPIKRLSESLAQAQEQARQQRQRAQHRPSESKSSLDAENEEATFTNGEENKSSEEGQTPKVLDETKETIAPTSPTVDAKDTTLPREVRIKLAKLAKYEDRHPSKCCRWKVG